MGVPAPLGVSASGVGPYGSADKANSVLQGTFAGVGPTAPFAFRGPMNLSIWAEFTTSLDTTAGSLDAVVGAAGPILAGAAVRSTNLPAGATIEQIGNPGATDVTLVLPPYTLWGLTKAGIAEISDLPITAILEGATVSGMGLAGTETVDAILTAAVPPTPGNPHGVRGTVELSAAPDEAPATQRHTPFVFTLDPAAAVVTGTDAAAVFTGAAIGMTGVGQLERSFDGGDTWLVCNIGSSGALAQWNTTTPVSLSFGEPELQVLYRLNLVSLTPAAGFTLNYRISETGQAATTLSVPSLS